MFPDITTDLVACGITIYSLFGFSQIFKRRRDLKLKGSDNSGYIIEEVKDYTAINKDKTKFFNSNLPVVYKLENIPCSFWEDNLKFTHSTIFNMKHAKCQNFELIENETLIKYINDNQDLKLFVEDTSLNKQDLYMRFPMKVSYFQLKKDFYYLYNKDKNIYLAGNNKITLINRATITTRIPFLYTATTISIILTYNFVLDNWDKIESSKKYIYSLFCKNIKKI